jgi:hypothetical protein
LRLLCPQLTYTFKPDPKIGWQWFLPLEYTSERTEELIDRIADAGKEFVKLLYKDDDKRMTLVQEKKMVGILVHAWRISEEAKVRLVFKEQPYVQRINAEIVQFYVPDACRFCLVDLP